LSSDAVDKLNFVWSHGRQIKLKGDRLMEDNKISQFIQALAFFELELEEITGQPGYEGRNKVIAIRKKGDNSRILCAYSTYDELFEWASQQFND
jgi:hypothetical protein